MEVDALTTTARVAVYVADYRLEGDLYVGTEVGGRPRRISDAFNGETPFIVLTDVSMAETNFVAEEPAHYDTIIVRKGEISFAIPLD